MKREYKKQYIAISARAATHRKVKKLAKKFGVPEWRVTQQAVNEYYDYVMKGDDDVLSADQLAG